MCGVWRQCSLCSKFSVLFNYLFFLLYSTLTAILAYPMSMPILSLQRVHLPKSIWKQFFSVWVTVWQLSQILATTSLSGFGPLLRTSEDKTQINILGMAQSGYTCKKLYATKVRVYAKNWTGTEITAPIVGIHKLLVIFIKALCHLAL